MLLYIPDLPLVGTSDPNCLQYPIGNSMAIVACGFSRLTLTSETALEWAESGIFFFVEVMAYRAWPWWLRIVWHPMHWRLWIFKVSCFFGPSLHCPKTILFFFCQFGHLFPSKEGTSSCWFRSIWWVDSFRCGSVSWRIRWHTSCRCVSLHQWILLSQWLNFKLSGITCSVGKIQFFHCYLRVQDGWVRIYSCA